MRQIRNAVISGTMLGIEDHGIMSFMIYIDYSGAGGSSQGFGGWALDEPKENERGNHIGRFGTAYGCEIIKRILEVVGVSSWEKLKGQPVRVDSESHKIHRIGHFMKEKWLDPEDKELLNL